MNTVLIFRKIVSSFSKKTKFLTEEEKLSFINSFSEPRNDFERTLCQYKCTMKRWVWSQRVLVNIGSFVMLLPYYKKIRHNKVEFIEEYDAIYFSDRISIDTVQDSIKKKYPRICTLKLGTNMSLDTEDIKFMHDNMKWAKVTPYYLLKFIFKLAMTAYVVKAYNPKAIITYSEESFTTSLITKYCEERGIEYIGIQHGERLLELKLPFFRCSKYYVWDDYYIELFVRMRCGRDQFIVERPKTVCLPGYRSETEKKYDYTFYLQDETTDTIANIYKCVENMWQQGYKVGIRPHPQWTKIELLECFPDEIIQSCMEVDLEESLSITVNVVGRCSTVLFQGYSVGLSVVIDDMSSQKEFYDLEESGYILLNVEHRLLSEFRR